jgi:hypothetical protein
LRRGEAPFRLRDGFSQHADKYWMDWVVAAVWEMTYVGGRHPW